MNIQAPYYLLLCIYNTYTNTLANYNYVSVSFFVME